MTLLVQSSPQCESERDYIFEVILEEFLGLPWRREVSERTDVCIKLEGQPGEIRLPDTFFALNEDRWLQLASMPKPPLRRWDVRELADDLTLLEHHVPVLYGNTDLQTICEPAHIRLPVDIFGSAFFMLSRYEELVTKDRDEHDRFPARSSVACREGFLDRPIVDEYVEILWAAMSTLWPRLVRKQHMARTFVTCDVDSAMSFRGGLRPVVQRMGDDILKRRSPAMAARNMLNAWRTNRGDLSADPDWNGLQWIMEANERAGHAVAFYFIPTITDARFEQPISLDDPRMRTLLRQIAGRGHEAGIHPGYSTYRHPEALSQSVDTLRRTLAEAGIRQDVMGGRQHYLRWDTSVTPCLWDAAGLDYDSTLSYADRPGFRCGTCREYPLYDLRRRRPLRLRERPLIVMECSIIAERYMGLGYTDAALDLMMTYKQICRQFEGDFTLLWHNSHLSNTADKEFYLALIGSATS
jgi:hypothetical protein